MEMNKAAVAVILTLCAGAGAGGAYLASRGAGDETRARLADVDSGGSAAAVEQSEALVEEAPPVSPSPAPARSVAETRQTAAPRAARPAPVRRPVPTAPAVVATPATVAERREPAPAPPIATAPAPEPEVARAPEPPAPQFEELIVAADSVLGLQVESSLSSERARVEDEVIAHVTRDVRVGDRVAIPSGSRVEGEVTLVERGGKIRDRARLGVRFTSVVLADGTRVPLETETIFREGDSPTRESAAKIGGSAIGGAIIGGILGGAKGAIIGGSAGAGAGTAVTIAGGRNAATLPSGTPVTVRITRPATVAVEQ
jgi:hypothetical protein